MIREWLLKGKASLSLKKLAIFCFGEPHAFCFPVLEVSFLSSTKDAGGIFMLLVLFLLQCSADLSCDIFACCLISVDALFNR